MEVKFNSNSHHVFSFVSLQSPWFLPRCVCLCCTWWGRCASPVAASKPLPVTKLWEGSPPQGSLYCARGPCWWQNDGNVFLRGEEVWSCNPLGGEGHAWTRMAGCASSYILSYSIAAASPPAYSWRTTHLPTQQIGVSHILQPQSQLLLEENTPWESVCVWMPQSRPNFYRV